MKTPFFLVGTGRCGSTFLYHLLRHHERVALTNEAGVLNFLFFCTELAGVSDFETRRFELYRHVEIPGIVGHRYVDDFAPLFTAHAEKILLEFYERTFSDREFTHWGDQLPDPRAARAMCELHPQTRIIILVRDPRDYVASMQSFARRDDIAKLYPYLAETSVEELAHAWNNVYGGSLRDFERPLVVRYETLVEQTRPTVAEILDHLGLPPSTAVDTAIDANDSFDGHATTASPAASMGRWRRDLDDRDAAQIAQVCAPLMARFDYA